MNEDNREKHLIGLANDIVKMTDSVIGVIGMITSLSSDDYKIVKELYEQLAGHELEITRDAIDIRKKAIGYLKSRNIMVPDEPTYDVEQFNPRSSADFFKTWDSDGLDFGRKR